MKYGARFTLLLVAHLFLAGCGGGTTPPGPDIVFGTVANTSYTFLDWDEGLRILIWTDVTGDAGANGGGSIEDEVYRLEGYALSPDGRSFEYGVETADGVTADFWIDGMAYDLEEGALFLVSGEGEEVEVVQLDRDLATLTATNEGVEAFGRDTAAIAEIMGQADHSDD